MYVVECKNADWNKLFLVVANTKKEAINKVWENHFSFQNLEKIKKEGYLPYYKKDLSAEKVSDLISSEGETICLA